MAVVLLKSANTGGRVVEAGSKTQKRLVPFCRVASGIAAIRRRTDRLRFWQKPKEEKIDYNEDGLNCSFHMRGVSEKFPQLVENNLQSSSAP